MRRKVSHIIFQVQMPGPVLTPTREEHFKFPIKFRHWSPVTVTSFQLQETACPRSHPKPFYVSLLCLNQRVFTTFSSLLLCFHYLFMFPISSLSLEQKDISNCELISPTWPEVDIFKYAAQLSEQKNEEKTSPYQNFFSKKKIASGKYIQVNSYTCQI